MAGSVFGAFSEMDIAIFTIVFIILLCILTLIELLFEKLDVLAEKYNQQDIFRKLKYELMVLGILSFVIFLTTLSPSVAKSDAFLAFETAHIVILFMAFSFIIQAVFLVGYATRAGNELVNIHKILIHLFMSLLQQGNTF